MIKICAICERKFNSKKNFFGGYYLTCNRCMEVM